MSFISPVVGTGGIGFCPACVAASASILTWLGLGVLIPVWRPIAFSLLFLGLLGFILDWRKHRNIVPILLLIAGGALLYLGRYVFGGKNFGGWQIWLPGAFLVISAAFYNRRLFSKFGINLYRCPECGYLYREKSWANKCEAWCKEYRSCNLEITKHSTSPQREN